MSAQPDHVPAPPQPPAPAAAARLLARIRADHDRGRAARWEPAFQRDWDKALEDSRVLYDLTPLHELIRTWQSRLDTAPAVDAFFAAGMDQEDGIAIEDIIGPRP
ncbi:DUF6247 family protein [Kitasatospora sp. NPDC101801]|uniref:DUF6247 family protein n=1 Tax=Kitasatospora sp. NPDC101801 TaxID=3364103 RepID=UPI0038096A41